MKASDLLEMGFREAATCAATWRNFFRHLAGLSEPLKKGLLDAEPSNPPNLSLRHNDNSVPLHAMRRLHRRYLRFQEI